MEKLIKSVEKSKFSSRTTINYENKCHRNEISRRIDWEGPQGPKISLKSFFLILGPRALGCLISKTNQLLGKNQCFGTDDHLIQ